MRIAVAAILFIATIPLGTAAWAKKAEEPQAPPAVMSRVIACTSVADAMERLACFDREVKSMSEAQRSGDLVAMDRLQVRKTRRSLFGLALPDLGVFGDSDSDDGDSAIETTIKAVRQGADGKWLFELAEGGRWQQLDSREFIVDPAAGQPIRIRRAAMGSYLANVNKQVNRIAIRVRRVQ